jgi:hypothetical protein
MKWLLIGGSGWVLSVSGIEYRLALSAVVKAYLATANRGDFEQASSYWSPGLVDTEGLSYTFDDWVGDITLIEAKVLIAD